MKNPDASRPITEEHGGALIKCISSVCELTESRRELSSGKSGYNNFKNNKLNKSSWSQQLFLVEIFLKPIKSGKVKRGGGLHNWMLLQMLKWQIFFVFEQAQYCWDFLPSFLYKSSIAVMHQWTSATAPNSNSKSSALSHLRVHWKHKTILKFPAFLL